MDLHALGEWIYGEKKVTIFVFVPGKWTRHVDALSNEWCTTFVYPTKLFFGWHRWFIPLADGATPDAISHIHMHTWPPIGTTECA